MKTMGSAAQRSEATGDAGADAALGGLLAQQAQMTRLFGVGVDILNASRALDAVSFELQLLARNGIVQAAQLNHATAPAQHGAGRSLLALAEILADCPRRIAPALATVTAQCRAIATHTAHCMGLARRHAQHLKALLLVLDREAPGERHALCRRLTGRASRRAQIGDISSTLMTTPTSGPLVRANLALLVERCTASARELAASLEAAAQCLRATDQALHAIDQIVGTVNYLGLNVAIEAAHCAALGARFGQLALEVDAAVHSLEQKIGTIRDRAGHGRRLIEALGA
jgi:hypothetical protein